MHNRKPKRAPIEQETRDQLVSLVELRGWKQVAQEIQIHRATLISAVGGHTLEQGTHSQIKRFFLRQQTTTNK